jgi:PRTRC genetic system ThiF family protein
VLATDRLIAPPCEVVLPTLEKLPTEQRFSADDREVIALAEILVKSDIAAVEDWEKSGRDAIKYLLLTLQRWIRNHGGASIQRRFDLDLTLSDRLVDYSDERGPEGTLYLIVDPESAAFVLLNPTIELLGSVHPFSQSEIGLYKSVVLANRLNLFWRLDWQGIPERLDSKRRLDGVDMVIGCVDTRKARAAIAKCAEEWSEVDYWLDLGNNADAGQFILGEPLNRRNRRHRLRLRTVAELFPEVIQGELDGDGLPSCSAAEALERQEPFINQTLAYQALAMLARLFRYGALSHHGCFLSLSRGSITPLLVDPKIWKRMMKLQP